MRAAAAIGVLLALACAAVGGTAARVAGQQARAVARGQSAAAAARADDPSAASWVWAPRRSVARAFFRRTFVLTEGPSAARLRVVSPGRFTAYVDGTAVVQGTGGRLAETAWVTKRLAKGPNVLAFECEAPKGPPGLAFDLMVRLGDRTVWVTSGPRTLASGRFAAAWQEPAYAARDWVAARVLGPAAIVARPAAEPAPGEAAKPSAGAGKPAGSAPSVRSTRPTPQAPRSAVDATRLLRVWDIRSGARAPGSLYAAPREAGQRMLMTCEVPPASLAPVVASAGFTLLQTDSDHLSTEEVAPGVWDYHLAEDGRRRAREGGFDWCYFPHYAFPPKWYADQVPFTRIRCLEHDRPAAAFSPWDPRFGRFLARGYEELASRYRESASALYLGVHGDYGEAGLLMGARTSVPGQREDWQRRFGDLHDHLGWWCGDRLARAAFRDAMVRKYGTLDVLNAAWKTRYSSQRDIAYPASPAAASRRWWLDFVDWYESSVGALTDTVSRVARRDFPNALLMVPAGFGDESPQGGNDNSLIPRIAARRRIDVRSTHGGFKPFAQNDATMLNRLASACKFYGVPFWTEPPGRISSDRQVSRIFEAVSLGSKGFYDWSSNVGETRDVYYRYGKFLKVERPVVDVAMFYPTTSHRLHPEVGYPATFERGCAAIRDLLNYDIVDERMVKDGALDRYRVLVLWEGSVVEADTLARIRDWVRGGGVVAAYDFGKIETVEGDRTWFADLFGYAGRLRPAMAMYHYVSDRAAPDRARVPVGLPAAAPYLAGDWHDPEAGRSAEREGGRWTGASADVLIPVRSGRAGTLMLRAAFPPEAGRRRRDVLVNGARVGVLDAASDTTYQFSVPAPLLEGREVAVVTIRSETWVPSELLKGNQDRRSLGTWVNWVELDTEGASGSTDPGLPAGRVEGVPDPKRLRGEWARQYGSGWTVYFPGRRAQLAGFYEVVRYLTYHLTDLDPTKRDAVDVDGAWDGMYATLLSDKILYYNPGPATVTRTIVLSPAAFAGRRDLHAPASFTHNVTVEPDSIAAVYFDAPPQELLLQCEKFTELGGLRPQEGAGFSPGAGATHVLIPVGGQIATRFECAVPGRYRVFYRAVRRGAPAGAQILLDGRPVAPSSAAAEGGPSKPDTSLAGTAALTRGVHTLTLRPLHGEDVRADFVLLSDDATIAGYRFGLR